MDPLVLGLAALSAACFSAFALWPRSSPRGQLEAVPAADDDPPAPVFGKAAASASESVAATVVDNTPATTDEGSLVRLRDVLRLRRRRGRCDWQRQDWRSTRGPGALALHALRPDRLRLRRRGADELQVGDDGRAK